LLAAAALGAAAQQGVTVHTGRSEPSRRIATFLEDAVKTVRTYHRCPAFEAHVSMRRRTAGLTQTVSADCRIAYRAPDYLWMEVKGLYPYTVTVSNGTVTTVLPESGDVDARPLASGERILDEFLGLCALTNPAAYMFEFEVEGDLHRVTATLRPERHMQLLDDIPGNAHRAVRRQFWVDPRLGRVVRTQTVTLTGDDTALRFREQWVEHAKESR
jgi:hypothetical protein